MYDSMVKLLKKIKGEDTCNKLEQLYFLYHKEMFYIAYTILKDYHEAEDVVQTTILKLSSRLGRIKNVNCIKTRAFLIIIVRNLSINIYNQRKKRKSVPIDDLNERLPDDDRSPEEQIIQLDQLEEAKKALAKIDTSYVDILVLKYHYSYSNLEIAGLMNLKEGNVRVKIHRAKQALKKILLRGDHWIEKESQEN
ncbi:MAG: RNA polymerase sigma factor [Clostridia bacterium]|nr:RNA polymerase sigma factor [Clostridia bacterium]